MHVSHLHNATLQFFERNIGLFSTIMEADEVPSTQLSVWLLSLIDSLELEFFSGSSLANPSDLWIATVRSTLAESWGLTSSCFTDVLAESICSGASFLLLTSKELSECLPTAPIDKGYWLRKEQTAEHAEHMKSSYRGSPSSSLGICRTNKYMIWWKFNNY